jgi:hypothetical protein
MNESEEPDGFVPASLKPAPVIASPSAAANSNHAQERATHELKTTPLATGETAKKRRKERQAWTGSASQECYVSRITRCSSL